METTEKRQRGRPRAFNGPQEAASVQSLDRALRILAIVADASGLSLSEIAARSGIAASTAYRMLTTLENHGMVEFDSTDQLWS
ncbi:MAG: MarR family transcriptional regulator, partial [Mesorhizobium sp.]